VSEINRSRINPENVRDVFDSVAAYAERPTEVNGLHVSRVRRELPAVDLEPGSHDLVQYTIDPVDDRLLVPRVAVSTEGEHTPRHGDIEHDYTILRTGSAAGSVAFSEIVAYPVNPEDPSLLLTPLVPQPEIAALRDQNPLPAYGERPVLISLPPEAVDGLQIVPYDEAVQFMERAPAQVFNPSHLNRDL
jgi:hypothetical protein